MLGFETKLKKQPVQYIDDIAPANYNDLALKIGVMVVAPAANRAARTLKENGVHVYPIERVEAYMDKKGYWKWFPLRSIDPAVDRFRLTNHEYPNIYGGVSMDVYDKAIPYPVLLIVDNLLTLLPDAHFYVAALDKNPDPFLGLWVPGDGQIHVVERWDEPSFR